MVGGQVDLVRHDRPGPEGASLEDGGEALVRRHDELGLLGADGVAVVAGADADAGVRALQLLGEGVVGLLGQGPVRDEVGVGAGVFPFDGAVDGFAADVGLPRRGGDDDEGAVAVEDAEVLAAVVEGEAAWTTSRRCGEEWKPHRDPRAHQAARRRREGGRLRGEDPRAGARAVKS